MQYNETTEPSQKQEIKDTAQANTRSDIDINTVLSTAKRGFSETLTHGNESTSDGTTGPIFVKPRIAVAKKLKADSLPEGISHAVLDEAVDVYMIRDPFRWTLKSNSGDIADNTDDKDLKERSITDIQAYSSESISNKPPKYSVLGLVLSRGDEMGQHLGSAGRTYKNRTPGPKLVNWSYMKALADILITVSISI
nr:unnamed protein product [Callosobruchus analis]